MLISSYFAIEIRLENIYLPDELIDNIRHQFGDDEEGDHFVFVLVFVCVCVCVCVCVSLSFTFTYLTNSSTTYGRLVITKRVTTVNERFVAFCVALKDLSFVFSIDVLFCI